MAGKEARACNVLFSTNFMLDFSASKRIFITALMLQSFFSLSPLELIVYSFISPPHPLFFPHYFSSLLSFSYFSFILSVLFLYPFLYIFFSPFFPSFFPFLNLFSPILPLIFPSFHFLLALFLSFFPFFFSFSSFSFFTVFFFL